MIEADYYFGEHLRWNLLWATPNYAGTFLACLIPLFWLSNHLFNARKKHLFLAGILLFCLEMGTWFVLCKTYSRGAFVSVVAAGLLAVGLLNRKKSFVQFRVLRNWTFYFRIIGLIGCLWGTSFFGRMEPSFIGHDQSVGNRIMLWKSGIRMIQVAPLGWGGGMSGLEYMNWFQPLDHTEGYHSMVNSYLTVGVEFGLPVLGITLACILGFIGIGIYSSIISEGTRKIHVLTYSTASLLSFAVSNIFSNLWIVPSLWILPGISLSLIIYFSIREAKLFPILRILGGGTLLSALCCLILLINGSSSNGKLAIQRGRNGISLQIEILGNRSKPLRIAFLPDARVFGLDSGKEIRRLAIALNRPVDIFVPFSLSCLIDKPFDFLIISGKCWKKDLNTLEQIQAKRVLLVHPEGKPSLSFALNSKVELLLPGYDQEGTDDAWISWANKRNILYRKSEGVGRDIRNIWPEIALFSFKEEK